MRDSTVKVRRTADEIHVRYISKKCPMCRDTLPSSDHSQYPIVYALLEVVDELSKNPKYISMIKKRLLASKEMHEYILNSSSRIKPTLDKLDLLLDNKTMLDTFLAMEDEDLDVEKTNLTLDAFDSRVREIRKQIGVLTADLKTYELYFTKVKVDMHSSEFKTEASFFEKICKGIMLDSSKFVAVANIEGDEKSARLSICNDLLLIHAFEILDAQDRVTKVGFTDLHENIFLDEASTAIYGFLTLSSPQDIFHRMILIDVKPEASVRGSQFLKFCTGEAGICYKGKEYFQNYSNRRSSSIPLHSGRNYDNFGSYFRSVDVIASVKEMKWNMEEMDIYTKYFLGKHLPSVSCKPRICYLAFRNDGSFEIFKHCEPNAIGYKDVIGIVIDPSSKFESSLVNVNFNKRNILDCGMAVRF